MISRPSWDDYLLGVAFLISRRSVDPATRHGCILVDGNRHLLATGYNAFPSKMDDEALPLCRPGPDVPEWQSKYPWMDHAEVNALANAATSLWSAVRPVRAFVTGSPCFACSKALCRHGILDWVVADRRGYTNPPEGEAENIERLVREKNVKIRRISPDLSWMVDPNFLGELVDLGFIRPDFTLQYDMTRPGL